MWQTGISIFMFMVLISMTFRFCNSCGEEIQDTPITKTIDEKIDSVKDAIWNIEWRLIDHEFSLDSLMAVIPKEIKKNDKLIEWSKKSLSATTDTTKSLFPMFQIQKDIDSASYIRSIDRQIFVITRYDSILTNYKKSLDSLLQLKQNK